MIRALVVADVAAQLVTALEADGDIAVFAQVTTAGDAASVAETDHPDIVVLALNLSDGSGQAAIEQIMDRAPTPILVVSAGTEDRSSPAVLVALVAGALDALPAARSWHGEPGVELRANVRRLSKAWVIRHLRGGRSAMPVPAAGRQGRGQPVVAIAASTGGPSALASLLAELAGLAAPVLIVQHLHPDFFEGLLAWMSRVSALPVELARHDQPAEPGRVYLAPGRMHLRLGGRGRLELALEPASIHRPSADVLFESVATHAGADGIGVVLTGMGDDGAAGLLRLRRVGGRTLAQDEESSAVFGMPRAAQRNGAVSRLLPLSKLGAAIRQAVQAVTKVQP